MIISTPPSLNQVFIINNAVNNRRFNAPAYDSQILSRIKMEIHHHVYSC